MAYDSSSDVRRWTLTRQRQRREYIDLPLEVQGKVVRNLHHSQDEASESFLLRVNYINDLKKKTMAELHWRGAAILLVSC